MKSGEWQQQSQEIKEEDKSERGQMRTYEF